MGHRETTWRGIVGKHRGESGAQRRGVAAEDRGEEASGDMQREGEVGVELSAV